MIISLNKNNSSENFHRSPIAITWQFQNILGEMV